MLSDRKSGKRTGRWSALLALLLATQLATGCAMTRPRIYPNAKVDEVGTEVMQADIDACLARAKDFTSGSAGGGGQVARDSATRAATGAGVGAAAGAAGGAIWGGAGRGAASGAAGGAAAGLMSGLLSAVFGRREPDPVFRNFVVRCLQEKGYDVIGWE